MKQKITMAMLEMVLMGCLLTGCGSASADFSVDSAKSAATSASDAGIAAQNGYYDDVAEYEAPEFADDAAASENVTQDMDTMTLLEEKLVYYCDLEIETLDYAGTMSSIKGAIAKYDGVIQSESESDSSWNWYYEDYRKTSGTMQNYLQVRIPSANYESFLSELDGVGKIISKSTSVENISQRYYDTTSQIEALKIQEQNLLDMLEQCETIEDMITVQERLTEVQYELNNLQTDKRYMDVDVAYSYVNINILEVMEYHYDSEPQKTNTFADRLTNTLKATGRGFLSFLEGLLFLVIRLFPYIIIIGILCFIFRKRIKRFFADKKAERAARRAEKQMRQSAIMRQAQMQQGAPQQGAQGQGMPRQNPDAGAAPVQDDGTPRKPDGMP